MISFTLKVAEIKKETPDTVTICLKQPGLKKIKYLPGQYLTLVFRINGRKYMRPYSFSSAPGVDQYLEVTIKRVTGGIVSNHVNDFIKIDDLIEVMPPMGDFLLDSEMLKNETHIVLWGAGSGITPLISIVKYVLNSNKGNKVTLIYGNKNFESVIFREKIKELEKLFPNIFKTLHFHTQQKISKNNPEIIEGRISPEKVLHILNRQIDLQNSIHFICGPIGLKDSVKQCLTSFSVSEDAIFTEDFEMVKNPADFNDVTTQLIELVKDGIITKVEVTKGKSMLEAGLDALLDLDYSCQTGSCTLCKAIVLTGSIKTIGITHMPDSLKSDECLLCCGYPLSNDVKVSVL